MHTLETELKRVVLVRLNSGDDILLSIRQAVEKHGIESGVILTGVGSVSRYHVHVVETTRLPPGDVFVEWEGPYDVLSVTGLIIDGRVHAHITLSDTDKAVGGHLEEGCRVLTFAAVVIGETPNTALTDWDQIGGL